MNMNMDKDLKNLTFICPICDEILTETTKASCGHLFCKYCITVWGKYSINCPQCSKPVTPLIHLIDLDEEIAEFFCETTDEALQLARIAFVEDRVDDLIRVQDTMRPDQDIFHPSNNVRLTKISSAARFRPAYGFPPGATPRPPTSFNLPRNSPPTRKTQVLNYDSVYVVSSAASRRPSSSALYPPMHYGPPSSALYPPMHYAMPSQIIRSARFRASKLDTNETKMLEEQLNKTYQGIFAIGRNLNDIEKIFAMKYLDIEDSDQERETELEYQVKGEYNSNKNSKKLPPLRHKFQTRLHIKSDNNMSTGGKLQSTASASLAKFKPGTFTKEATTTSVDELLNQTKSAIEVQEFLKEFSIEKIAKDPLQDDDDDEKVGLAEERWFAFKGSTKKSARKSSSNDETVHLDHGGGDTVEIRTGSFPISSTEDELKEVNIEPNSPSNSVSIRKKNQRSIKAPDFKIHPEVQKSLDKITTKVIPRIPRHSTGQQSQTTEPCLDLFRKIRQESGKSHKPSSSQAVENFNAFLETSDHNYSASAIFSIPKPHQWEFSYSDEIIRVFNPKSSRFGKPYRCQNTTNTNCKDQNSPSSFSSSSNRESTSSTHYSGYSSGSEDESFEDEYFQNAYPKLLE